MQLDDNFAPLSTALSFTTLWWELCDNICIQSKAATFFVFPPVPLKHKHFWHVARHRFCVHSQPLKAVFVVSVFPEIFCPIKGDCHEFGGIIQHTSISEVKWRWDWSPHGLWQIATLACLPNFSIWTDALTKIQRSLFCVFYLASDWQHYNIYQFTCFGQPAPKKPAQKCRGKDVFDYS